jgi:hypothetical protein
MVIRSSLKWLETPPREQKHRGIALIMSMVFIAMFSALAVAMASMSGNNTQVASNQHKIDGARACAESGFDVLRCWLKEVWLPGTTQPSQILNQIRTSLNQGIANVYVTCNGSTLTIPSVTLDSATGRSFHATITKLPVTDSNTYQVDVTGIYGSTQKTIRANYVLDVQGNTVFDFGVATKGPLSLSGNIELEGINVSVEASVYIESENSTLALSIVGNSQIAGDVSIVNSNAMVNLQGGQAGIGGETGQAAINDHVDFGVPTSDFPVPVPGEFTKYINSVIDANTNTSAKATYQNVRIVANTNPKFTKQINLKGVIFIEAPNVVEFAGGADITGIIVGNGNLEDNSGTNQLKFTGSVTSHPITDLPDDAQFGAVRKETGTFVMAPGFNVSFGGNFNTLNGAIAGNGIEFYGNAGGIINGSVINYSEDEMTLSGNSDLYFNRSGITEAPAGFVPEFILDYNPTSYTEVII